MLEAHGRLLAYHARMLNDETRVEAFRTALSAVVREGDIVLDVGTGTGVLATMAADAGASRVYALERGEVAALAIDVVRASGYADRVHVLNVDSQGFRPEQPIDVCVSETLWNFGLGEGIVAMVRDLRRRGVLEGARMVPRRFAMLVAPVVDPQAWSAVEDWSDRGSLRLEAARRVVLNNVHIADVRPRHLGGEARTIASYDLEGPLPDRADGRVEWQMPTGTVVHGLCGWFVAELAPGVHLANPPGSDTHWRPVLLPVDPPLNVAATLRAHVATAIDGRHLKWSLSSRDGVRTHSTFQGELLPPRLLGRRDTRSPRSLSPRGRAACAALALFERGASLEEADAALAADFATALPTPEDRRSLLHELIEQFTS